MSVNWRIDVDQKTKKGFSHLNFSVACHRFDIYFQELFNWFWKESETKRKKILVECVFRNKNTKFIEKFSVDRMLCRVLVCAHVRVTNCRRSLRNSLKVIKNTSIFFVFILGECRRSIWNCRSSTQFVHVFFFSIRSLLSFDFKIDSILKFVRRRLVTVGSIVRLQTVDSIEICNSAERLQCEFSIVEVVVVVSAALKGTHNCAIVVYDIHRHRCSCDSLSFRAPPEKGLNNSKQSEKEKKCTQLQTNRFVYENEAKEMLKNENNVKFVRYREARHSTATAHSNELALKRQAERKRSSFSSHRLHISFDFSVFLFFCFSVFARTDK